MTILTHLPLTHYEAKYYSDGIPTIRPLCN
jgi:hypothetical protein